MSRELVMPSNHFILCRPLLLLPSIFPRIRVFSIKSVLHIRWPDTGTGLYQTAIYHLYSSKSHMRCLRLLLCVFSYCSWGSQGKNTEVVCHSLLEQITFCQTSPPWSIRLGWPPTAWLSFVELDKAVVHVIILVSFLWLWFQSVCPLMPSLGAYRPSGVSLTLDVG